MSKEDLEIYEQAKVAYYSGSPIMSDEDFDRLEKSIFSKGEAPIGISYAEGIVIPYNPASLVTIEKEDEVKKIVKSSTQYICMDKLNGVSAIYWNDGTNHILSTKGRDKTGTNLSRLIEIFNLPKIAEGIIYRGELILPKAADIGSYKNNLSAVFGIISKKNMADISKPLLNQLNFVLYEVFPLYNAETFQFDKQLNMLKKFIKNTKNVFIVNNNTYAFDKDFDLSNLSNILRQMRHDSIYDMDGIVVTNTISNNVDNIYPNGSPRYKMAFKELKDTSFAETTIIGIATKQGAKGNKIPVLLIEPIILDGKTIRRVSSGGIDNMVRNKLGIGAKVNVKLGGEVIPAIHSVISGVEFDPKSIDLSIDYEEQFIKQCTSFFKKCGCKGLGPALIKNIYEENKSSIANIFDFFDLDYSFLSIKKQNLMAEQLEIVKENMSMITLCSEFSLFGPGIGKSILKSLFELYSDIFEEGFDVDNIEKFPGLATKLEVLVSHAPDAIELIRENMTKDEIELAMERE